MKINRLLHVASLLLFLVWMPGVVMAQTKTVKVSAPVAKPAVAPWATGAPTPLKSLPALPSAKTTRTRPIRSLSEVMGKRAEKATSRAARLDKTASLHQRRGRTELAAHYKRLAELTRAMGVEYQALKTALERQPLPKKITTPASKTK